MCCRKKKHESRRAIRLKAMLRQLGEEFIRAEGMWDLEKIIQAKRYFVNKYAEDLRKDFKIRVRL